jgi:hypothetical protein
MSQRTVYCDRCGEPKTPSEGFGHDCEAKSVPMVKVEHGCHEDEATAVPSAITEALSPARLGGIIQRHVSVPKAVRDQIAAALSAALAPVVAQHVEDARAEVAVVRMKRSCPNYDKGQIGLLRETGERVQWVEFGESRQFSHGPSESTGCWCGSGEYEVVLRAEGGTP